MNMFTSRFVFEKKEDCVLVIKNLSEIQKKDIEIIKKRFVDSDKHHVILKNFGKTKLSILKNINLFSKIFGKKLNQDKSGNKIISIIPAVKKINLNKKNNIKINLRYHESNKGGFIHTDGPQLVVPPKYVLMGCISNSKKGGHSILSSMIKIFNYLKKKDNKTLNELKKKFFIERRGFYENGRPKFLNKPIITFENRDLRFRYLRDYMNEAYKIKSIKLSKLKIKALDKLDHLLSLKKFQYTYKLKKGDVLLLNNYKMAHGRTSFSLNENKRHFIRVWFAK